MSSLRAAAFMVGLSALSTAGASPTANEYGDCHRQAGAALAACLDQHPGAANLACWAESRNVNDRCYAAVVHSHRRDPAREEALRRAREEAVERRNRQSASTPP